MNKYGKIVFDVDSTIVTIEGLDELAKLKGKNKEVAELTRLSMDGKVKLEEVFALKMAMIRPSKQDMLRLGNLYINHITEDVPEIIYVLKKLKKDVLQVTGNFYPAVQILADYLKIPRKNIFANKIYFNKKGEYIGFDVKGPLSISGGKKIVMRKIQHKEPKKKIAFIGDGSTDMDTKPPVDLFIGYGGVVVRENVKKHSDIYMTTQSLSPILRIILTKEEQETGKKINQFLFDKADKLIKNFVISY